MKKWSVFTCALIGASITYLHADTIAQWNFNSVPPDGESSSGTNVPSIGVGTASLLGGVEATFSDGSTNDPAPGSDDSGWHTTHYPAQGTGNETGGLQFDVSTVGFSNIVVRWDQRVSTTASKYYRLQYSTDGVTFVDFPTSTTMMAAVSTSTYYEGQTNSLAAISGVNNNPSFAFRIVSEWEYTAIGSGASGYATTYGTNTYSGSAGTVRFDLVTVTGTPIPGANTPPVISGINNQTIRVNQSTGPLSFTVLDAEDPAASLTLAKTSTDPSVIPLANIVFGGSSASRTVNATAAAQPGNSTITVWVIDTGGRSNSSAFNVMVLPANTAPVISSIDPTNTLINTATPAMGFMVGDAETSASSLTVSATSANLTLVPNANLALGGSSSNRSIAVTPAAGQIGVAPITVTVSDGTNSASSTFGLMVRPSASVLFYEAFAYPDGSVVTNSGGLWDTRSGTVGQCLVTNGQLQVTTTQSEDIVGTLAGAPWNRNSNTVLYAAFKANFLSLPKLDPEYFSHFGTGSNLRGRIYAGMTNAGANSFRLLVANGTGGAPVELASDLHTNTTYTLVTRYNIDSATATLWVNPGAESDPGITATDAQSAVSISAYGFRQDSGLGATILVDDFRAGLSFSAVTSGITNSPSPIPLQAYRSGNNLILSWSNPSFALQAAPAVKGPYTNVTGATSPFSTPIPGPARFFRLKY